MNSSFYTTLWSRDVAYRRQVHESITRVLGRRLGRYLAGGQVFLSQFAVKQTGGTDASRCPWHQDWSFVDETRHQPVSLWCPLVDIETTNGPLAVVPGSHHLSDCIRPNYPETQGYPHLDALMPEVKEKYALELTVKAGECVFYDGSLLHGSRPNQSSADRPVVVAVVAPDDAPLRHYWRVDERTVEVLSADVAFFRDEVTWGHRPEGRAVIETIPHPVDTRAKTEADYLAAIARIDREHGSPEDSATAPRGDVSRERVFIDPEIERLFRRQGYVVAPLLTSEQVNELLAYFAATSTPAVGGFHGTMYHGNPDYRRRIDEVIRPIVNSAISRWLRGYRACMCNFMVKEPVNDESELPLHQDWSFVNEPAEVSVHVWCPLVDVDHENGNLAVVAGSHHLSDPIRAFADDCPFREQFGRIRERYLRELPMKAGEAVFFDGRLIHSSPPNRSANRRITVQAITVPKSSAIHHSWRVSPTQVELFEVTDEFFFSYILHEPPKGAPSIGLVDYSVRQRSADEVDALATYQS